MRNLKTLLGGAALAVVLFAGTNTKAYANPINTTNFVFDTFNSPFHDPDPNLPQDYWWRTLLSADQNGFVRVENEDCNLDVCLTQEHDGPVNYAQYTLSPQQNPGSIRVADINEERNAYGFNLVHRWAPTAGHPILVTSRMKFTSGYKADGSGNAVGSSVFWMWNHPLDINQGFIAPIRAIGFSWTDSQTFGGFYKGLKATVVDNTVSAVPVFTLDLPLVDMNNWFEASYKWSVDLLGVQTVSFYVNGNLVGATPLAQSLPALTLEYSIDNQSAQIDPLTGNYQINFRNPSVEQSMFVDHLSIARL